MLRIAICDDEDKVCFALENFINMACVNIHIETEIDIFSSGSVLRSHLQHGSSYNIFFLDIELKDETGIYLRQLSQKERLHCPLHTGNGSNYICSI